MMNTCRTCLKSPANKTISQLERGIKDVNIKCIDIMLFCLDIKITEDSKIAMNLCNNCYRKIISFYKFKALSLKNDAYLKSLYPVIQLDQKRTVYVDENGVKHENSLETDEYGPSLVECNSEINIKKENTLELKGEEILGHSKDEDISEVAVSDEGGSSLEDEETLGDDQIHPKDEDILEDAVSDEGGSLLKDEETLGDDQIHPKNEDILEDVVSDEGGSLLKDEETLRDDQIHPKDEDILENAVSNEEPLSVVQKVKHENISNRMKAKVSKCKKQGCPKEPRPCAVEDTLQEWQICQECGLSVLDLQAHWISHQPRDERWKLQCKACPKMFVTEGSRNRHYKVAHLGMKSKSDICNKAPKRKKRSSPIKKSPNVKNGIQGRQICEECGMLVLDLPAHSLTHQPRDKRQMLQCKACPKKFVTRGGRRRHYKIWHLGVKPKCDICDKEVVHLAVHKLQVHNTSAMPFCCATCERRFVSKPALKQHMTSHTQEAAHECEICHKKFRVKSNLNTHIRQVHEKEKKHHCELCSKAFFCSTSLKEHIRTHTKERSYKCTKCGKGFMTKVSLRNHQIKHSDVKNFKCEVCDMSFKLNGYLKLHMITHTKEKRYSCQYCGKRFGRPDSCRRHEAGHQKHATPAD